MVAQVYRVQPQQAQMLDGNQSASPGSIIEPSSKRTKRVAGRTKLARKTCKSFILSQWLLSWVRTSSRTRIYEAES